MHVGIIYRCHFGTSNMRFATSILANAVHLADEPKANLDAVNRTVLLLERENQSRIADEAAARASAALKAAQNTANAAVDEVLAEYNAYSSAKTADEAARAKAAGDDAQEMLFLATAEAKARKEELEKLEKAALEARRAWTECKYVMN